MHLLKTVLASAIALLLASRGAAQDPAYYPPPAMGAAEPLVGLPPPALPGRPDTLGLRDRPPEATRIDQACAASVPPIFDVTIESLLWRLEHTSGQPLILNPILGTQINTDALDLGLRAGPRVNVAYLAEEGIDDVQGIETSYFGVYNWSHNLVETAPAGTFLRLPDQFGNPGVTADFSGADQMRVHYQSQLNSVELNLLLGELHAPFSWIFGGRFLRLEENFNLDSFTAGRMSFYQVDTRNDLFGIQWGARSHIRRGRWIWVPVAKIGVYSNNTQQSTLVTDNDRTVVLRNFGTERSVTSAVFDGGLTVTYEINNCWLATAGYNVFWMNSVARAVDQLDFSNSPISGSRLFLRNDALAHGLNFGIERRW